MIEAISQGLRKTDIFGQRVPPQLALLEHRGDIASLMFLVKDLLRLCMSKSQVVLWFCFLHLLHGREPLCTVLTELRQIKDSSSKWDALTVDRVLLLAALKLLESRFTPTEMSWDTRQPWVAGAPAYRALLKNIAEVESYARRVADVPPSEWTGPPRRLVGY